MKENIVLFLTHYDDYMDTLLLLNGDDDGFDKIREMWKTLKRKQTEITLTEFHEIEADIFMEYLKMVGVV